MIIPNQILSCVTCQAYTKLVSQTIKFIGNLEKADVIVFTSNQIKLDGENIKDGISLQDYQTRIDNSFKQSPDYKFFSFLTDGELSRLFITPMVRCDFENTAISKVCCSTWTKLLMSVDNTIKHVVIVGKTAKNSIISNDDMGDFSIRKSHKFGKIFLYVPDISIDINKEIMEPYRESFLKLVNTDL